MIPAATAHTGWSQGGKKFPRPFMSDSYLPSSRGPIQNRWASSPASSWASLSPSPSCRHRRWPPRTLSVPAARQPLPALLLFSLVSPHFLASIPCIMLRRRLGLSALPRSAPAPPPELCCRTRAPPLQCSLALTLLSSHSTLSLRITSFNRSLPPPTFSLCLRRGTSWSSQCYCEF